MPLPVGVYALGSFKGAQGDRGLTGSLAFAEAVTVPADQPASVEMVGPESNRGARFYVPRGLSGGNAIANDAAFAEYLGAADSATRQTADKVFKRDISVASFGAVGDGVSDDTAAISAAAVAARDAGIPLYVPSGTFRLTARVDVYGSMTCDGRFVVAANSAGSIRLARDSSPTILPSSGLTGLTAGSTQIGGLGGQRGTLVLRSTELLINRDSAANPYYTKTDVVAVIDSNGTVFPPLESTYDPAQLTATFHPVDLPTVASKVTITVDGAVEGTADNVLSVYRSKVTLDEPVIVNSTTLNATSAIRLQDTAYTTVIRPTITGFYRDGAGYGIAAYNSVVINIDHASISRCRHALSGRHTKQIVVTGGDYEGGIDNHWSLGLVLDGVTSIARSGGTHVAIAGRDLIIRNSKFFGGRNVVGIRLDTPELGGELTVKDSGWWPEAAAQPWMIGYSSLSRTLFDFGRTLASPDITTLQRITITCGTAWDMRLINIGGNLYFNRKYWRRIVIDDITVINPAALWAYVDSKTNAYHPGETAASDVLIRNVKFPNVAASFAAYIGDTEDTASGGKFSLRVENCAGVRVSLPEAGMAAASVVDSELLQWIRSSTSTQTWSGDFTIATCTLPSTVFNGNFEMDFRGNKLSGALASTIKTLDNRIKSYDANLHVAGSTGLPTRANGYRNSGYYSA